MAADDAKIRFHNKWATSYREYLYALSDAEHSIEFGIGRNQISAGHIGQFCAITKGNKQHK